jgi:hypothetical protein
VVDGYTLKPKAWRISGGGEHIARPFHQALMYQIGCSQMI